MGVRAVLLALVAMVVVASTGHAQTTWRDPLNHFTVELPQGWNVRPIEPGAWLLGGENAEQDGACRVNQVPMTDLPIARSALERAARDPGFINATIEGLFNGLENAVPRVIVIAGPNQPPVITATLLTTSGRRCAPGERCGRMAVTFQTMVRPGASWAIMCRVIEERMRTVEPQLLAIVSSFEVGETYGATNR